MSAQLSSSMTATLQNSHGNNGHGNGNGNGNGNGMYGSVLVWGGGIAGIQASLDLSAAGYRVYLVEESPTIGGSMARLDKTFPTGDCATCIISPKLVECIRDYNIDVITMADVIGLEGEPGRFVAEVRQRPRSVNPAKCTGCGDCWSVCPVRNVAVAPPAFQPTITLNEADAGRLHEILTRYENDPGRLMPVLQEINQSFGYIPRGMLEQLAFQWGLRLAAVLRVASFYDRFHLAPTGRHVIEVCAGTSCHSQGSHLLLRNLEKQLGLQAGETDMSGRFTLRTVRCLGLCALSPAMKIAGQNFGHVHADQVPEILEQFS
jgi:NADH:ubiquinone oxidoreductase subunit E/NAD-dependent dihydropyrimidine dehydrogenase PreA subunit